MSKTQTKTTADEIEPVYTTETAEDVEDILRRAANYAEANTYGGETVGAELRQAADFVAEEMLGGDDE